MLTVDDYLAQPAAPATARVAYGPLPDQFCDLYIPDGPGPHPVVLLIHGGCWRAQFGLAPLGPLCTALRDEGLAVWNMEYRRLGGGGGWPATFADVAAGADQLRALAVERRLDLGRALAAGHSAGGQLALWLAARDRLPADNQLRGSAPLKLRGVVALAALADLVEGQRRNLCRGAVDELMGGANADEPLRYAQGSPAALLPLGVRQRHVGGADDQIVPADYLRMYVAAARAAGDDCTLDLRPGVGHFELVVPGSSAWPAVRAAVLDLLPTEE